MQADTKAYTDIDYESFPIADPTYSPFEEELWPLINGTIHQTLQPHPEVFAKVVAAVDRALETHRGWRNLFPAQLDAPTSANSKKIINSRNEPGDLVQSNHCETRGHSTPKRIPPLFHTLISGPKFTALSQLESPCCRPAISSGWSIAPCWCRF